MHEREQPWIPHAERAVVLDAAHCMPQDNPRAPAEFLADFFARHPIEE